jgi:hypothetical protein
MVSLLLFRRGVAEVQARWGVGRLDGQVAKQFLWADRDQPFLLPVDMREWLPDDHVVWVLLAVIDRLDVSSLEARYALGGAGRRAFDPRMLLALLIYCYSGGPLTPSHLPGIAGRGWRGLTEHLICPNSG